jgi:transcriptional regulator with XRE-family HTH domain
MWLVGYMLTRSEFVAWLDVRRSAGDSFTAIGRDLGVSRQAVQQWLSGATQPSRMALTLAEQLCRVPLELAPGLPVAAERDRLS